MIQRLCGLCLAFVALLANDAGTPAHGQSQHPVHSEDLRVELGRSAVALNAPWRFTIGDSPLDPVSHAPVWAQPGFDDSAWEPVDLTPSSDAIDPVAGSAGYVRGWTTRGHPGYWGFAWYRIHIQLSTSEAERLALGGPADVDDAYQVFANGVLLGSFGDFSGRRPVMYYTRPMMFGLPNSGSGSATGKPPADGPQNVVLAFRVWMDPSTLFTSPDAGGFHTAPVLGAADSVAMADRIRWVEIFQAYGATLASAALYILLAVVSLSLVMFDRSDRVYFWMAGVFLIYGLEEGLGIINTWTQFLGGPQDTILAEVFLQPILFAGWVMVWWVWFHQERPKWLPAAMAGLLAVYMVANWIGQGYLLGIATPSLTDAFKIVSWAVRLVFIALMLWIVREGSKREGLGAWLVLPAVLLFGVARFTRELRLLHIRTNWFPFGFRVRLLDLANLALVVVLALLLLRRLFLSVKNQRRLALDVKQAQEVQQVILPETRAVLPGLVVETEYRPALEVGGDFFQVLPNKADGSLLVVAGDVTGKGLKAGMLVALLVGAIRTAAESSTVPEEILHTLNRRLIGRGDAHATCLALRIEASGRVTLANAGHLAPYLNGEPVTMEGALPLGLMEGVEFSVTNFSLNVHDRLVLVSDGVAEAKNANGSLFGFERVNELLRRTSSATEVASAAQKFGQDDDISVISITRTEEPTRLRESASMAAAS